MWCSLPRAVSARNMTCRAAWHRSQGFNQLLLLQGMETESWVGLMCSPADAEQYDVPCSTSHRGVRMLLSSASMH